MADLVTHLATAFFWKAATRRPHLTSFVLGVALPDLVGRAPVSALQSLHRHGVTAPDRLVEGIAVLHLPLGFVPVTLALALLFEERRRAAVWMNLLGGCSLHLALDLTQHHVGKGYMLLFPFTDWDFELGWIGSEATVPYAPFLLPISLMLWAWRRPKGEASGAGGQATAPRSERSAGDGSAG